MSFTEHLRARPRLFISLLVGLLFSIGTPGIAHPITRALLGWNVGVWLFIVLIGWMMVRADHDRLRRTAAEQAEGAVAVLGVVIVAALVSLIAIVIELSAAKAPNARHALPHVLLALTTVTGSWLMLPTLFAMSYAALYYRRAHGEGLVFPSADATFKPDYFDFLYFSFTIAVASQTADVAISTRAMRRLVLLQSLLSFVFNTTILAFTINIAASLF